MQRVRIDVLRIESTLPKVNRVVPQRPSPSSRCDYSGQLHFIFPVLETVAYLDRGWI